VNESVVDNPEILNESPYEKGWLVKVESETAVADSADLLEYEDYKEEIA
jgi:glycine cleavage system H protein